ncbi:hypothetical protein RUND412_002187 [Rhizina undulata]
MSKRLINTPAPASSRTGRRRAIVFILRVLDRKLTLHGGSTQREHRGPFWQNYKPHVMFVQHDPKFPALEKFVNADTSNPLCRNKEYPKSCLDFYATGAIGIVNIEMTPQNPSTVNPHIFSYPIIKEYPHPMPGAPQIHRLVSTHEQILKSEI